MLVDKQIRERCKTLIFPFEENHVTSISYDLDFDGYINKDGGLSKEKMILRPGESVMIKTVQSLKMPNDLVGIIGERNSRIRQGLNVVDPHYFPGHTTAIYLRVTNLSPIDIELQHGDGIARSFSKSYPKNQKYPMLIKKVHHLTMKQNTSAVENLCKIVTH